MFLSLSGPLEVLEVLHQVVGIHECHAWLERTVYERPIHRPILDGSGTALWFIVLLNIK